MATPTDPTFGAGFNAAEFRAAITSTMEMGLPNAVEERPTFRWKTRKTFEIADPEGRPYDFGAAPTKQQSHEDVQVPCSVQFINMKGDGNAVGQFDQPRAVLTLLDEHYTLVEGADEVLLGGNTYKVDYVAPPTGLFSVDVYKIYVLAVDES